MSCFMLVLLFQNLYVTEVAVLDNIRPLQLTLHRTIFTELNVVVPHHLLTLA